MKHLRNWKKLKEIYIIIDKTIEDGANSNDERLKNGGSVLTIEYFDRLLEQIRETRSLERIVSAYFDENML